METLWGSGKDLTALQMSVRALAIFFITLALVRLSGRRSFGRKTAFDNIIVIILIGIRLGLWIGFRLRNRLRYWLRGRL